MKMKWVDWSTQPCFTTLIIVNVLEIVPFSAARAIMPSGNRRTMHMNRLGIFQVFKLLARHIYRSVHDPYRWLEDPNSEETKAFVDAQNALTMPFINSCPVKKDIRAKIATLWDFPKYRCPFKRGPRYFYFYNSGLQNQDVLYVMDQVGGSSKVFFDPNALDAEGLTALSTYGFSEDGEYFAYGLSHAGSDWVVIKVKKVSTGEDLPDKLERVKFSGISWTHDNKGFFYAILFIVLFRPSRMPKT
ncbi:unnamed protein product [Dibothriocephalus latus]|uniref:Peptidase S9A N-terminal domain-containing protein n=1 Tax=Dibothriocephalus latus TaxID=60516 RepID=A0A3P7QLA2_DIBLA|nr:unnamed protein product [Dibothriocephalus latus]